jgi:alpha-ribazole phosphatase/probable phosphoglycerate mutase
MKMSTIVFIRHCETDMAGRFCGHADPELNVIGERQLTEVMKAIVPLGVQRILSSDLRRASRTACAIARHIGVNVELQPALREIYFGLWEGLNWKEIEYQFPQEADRWLREFPWQSAPKGEKYTAFTARIDAAIAPLLDEMTACTTTAIVTHRGVMRYALTKFFGFSEAEAGRKTASYGALVTATVRSCNREVLP